MQRIKLTLLLAFSVFMLAYGSDKIKKTEIKHITSKTKQVAIEGRTVDAVSGEMLTGVAVTLEGLNKTVYTDFDGNFKFQGLQPGKYDITINQITYKEVFLEKIELAKETSTHITISLVSN